MRDTSAALLGLPAILRRRPTASVCIVSVSIASVSIASVSIARGILLSDIDLAKTAGNSRECAPFQPHVISSPDHRISTDRVTR